MIEAWDGELRVIVWGDINQEDLTHIISLEGARRKASVMTMIMKTFAMRLRRVRDGKTKKRMQIKAWRAERVMNMLK